MNYYPTKGETTSPGMHMKNALCISWLEKGDNLSLFYEYLYAYDYNYIVRMQCKDFVEWHFVIGFTSAWIKLSNFIDCI